MKGQKGEYGYIKRQKRVRLIRTVLFFVAAFAVFFAGVYLNHGDKRSIYTVIAMVGVIPAAMAAVSAIMIWLRPSMDAELYRRISSVSGNLQMLYELFLTTREKNLYLDAAVITGDQVVAYTHEDVSTADLHFFEEHITRSLRTSGLKRSVKIFDSGNQKQFLSRIEILNDRQPPESDTDYLVRTALLAIAL
ncbi:MAG: hypothetical protein IJI10_13055 [Eubacterium sp.]|nr:hypothetical protein [Eubacterium sp.]